MPQAVTFENVWGMFQEMVREDRARRAESDRQFREMNEESDRKSRESDRKFRETDRKFREMNEESDRKSRETDRKFREMNEETNRKFQETDRKIDKVATHIDRLGGRLGEFVEGLVAPACKTLFAQRGIPVHKVSRRVEANLPGGRRMEIDLFVVNTDAVVLVEVKSKLTIEDVREHLTRLAEFKGFFSEYVDKRAVGAVAGMVIEEHVCRFAINQGLFVIEQAGETLRMANDEAFIPRTW